MWFNPRRSRKAIDILSCLAKLKLTNDEISVACPRAFAALLGNSIIYQSLEFNCGLVYKVFIDFFVNIVRVTSIMRFISNFECTCISFTATEKRRDKFPNFDGGKVLWKFIK